MFHHLRGTIVDKRLGFLVLEVSGVGYQLQITHTSYEALPRIGEEAHIYVHLAVRETEWTMYGFSSIEERSLFLNLLKVSGVGPALSIQILSQAPLQPLVQAVVCGDTDFLKALKGVGKKTAERIVVELRDRLNAIPVVGDVQKVNSSYPEDAYLALLALGLSPEKAKEKLDAVSQLEEKPESTDVWIRQALKHG